MLRSLFSGISGLRSHQTMLDVTGNNIANVNTTGFKSSQIQFQDTLSQVLSNAGGAQNGQGGTNPAQVGLGVRVAGITTNFTQGASQLTGRSTDMMIQGDGFFAVRKGAETYYTRDGSFDFDATGQMVLPGDGALVQGWAAVNGVIDTTAPLTDLKVPAGTLMAAQASGAATFQGNLDSSAAPGTAITRSLTVYNATGEASTLNLTFTKGAATGDPWTLAGSLVAAEQIESRPFEPERGRGERRAHETAVVGLGAGREPVAQLFCLRRLVHRIAVGEIDAAHAARGRGDEGDGND